MPIKLASGLGLLASNSTAMRVDGKWLLTDSTGAQRTYCCESFSRIIASAANRYARHALIAKIDSAMPADEAVDPDEYIDILRDACSARNE